MQYLKGALRRKETINLFNHINLRKVISTAY